MAEPVEQTTLNPNAFIGIFWIYRDSLFAHFPVSPSPENEAEVSFDSNDSHFAAWDQLQAQGKLKVLPRRLQDEYDSIPRGRVLFNKLKGKFVILHGKSFTPKHRELVMEAFRLPTDQSIEDLDMHYDPLPPGYSFLKGE